MILILIVAIVLINFYVKRDIYLASIIGLILLDIYLIIYYDVVIVNMNTSFDLEIFLKVIIFGGILVVFRKLNDITSFTNTKNDIRNIFDWVFKDKKLKIFTLFLLGAFFALVPFIGIIYLIFIAIILRISKYNLVFISILSVFLYSTFNYLLTFNSTYIPKQIGVKFIIVLYILFLIAYIFEKIRKIDELDKYEVIFDVIFLVIMFVINLYIYIVLKNLYTIRVANIISSFLTWIIAIILLNKFPIFINKESKEQVPLSKNSYLLRMRLPYFTLVVIAFLEILGFILCIINFYLGSMYIIILNTVFICKFKGLNKNHNPLNLTKLLIFVIVLYTNLFISQFILEQNMDAIINIVNNNIIILRGPIEFLLNSQDLFLFPNLGFINNNLTGTTVTNAINLKFLLILKVQMYFSLTILVAISYIFSFKKREIIHIVTLIIVTSMILQFLIYLYY